MPMKNLEIVEHWEIFQYAIIHGGGYWLQVHIFELKHYMYMCSKQH